MVRELWWQKAVAAPKMVAAARERAAVVVLASAIGRSGQGEAAASVAALGCDAAATAAEAAVGLFP